MVRAFNIFESVPSDTTPLQQDYTFFLGGRKGSSRHRFSVAVEALLELALADKAGLQLKEISLPASRMLGLKACVTPLPGQDHTI